ncbi:MAG: hypothetical protein AB1649_14285 [Chloroflexota bacterium]
MKDEDQTRKSAPGQNWDKTVDRSLTRDEKQDSGTIRVGQRLREIRAERGLSMRALAEVSA